MYVLPPLKLLHCQFHILDGLKSQEFFGPQPQTSVRTILDKCTRDTADQVLLVRKGHPETPAPIILRLEVRQAGVLPQGTAGAWRPAKG
jgi:hypothetical protein